MKKLAISLFLAGLIVLPALAEARPVTLTTQLKNYGGNGAYMAIYLTDGQGKYQKTLWVSGKKTKYFKHLRDWARGSGLSPSAFDGISGASVNSGRTLKVTVEIADAFINKGYEIRVDSAVEDGRDNPVDVRAPLTSAGVGKPIAGRGYVQSFTYSL